MGFHKARHLIEKIADWQNLQDAADDAVKALDDSHAWYAVKFEKHRDERLRDIQQMILSGVYPTKEYHPVTIRSEEKDRDISPLHFDPWSMIFHAFKRVLDPIALRVMIYDASAGVIGKGQHFAARRVKMMIRRYKFPFYSWSDYRKFYQSLPHDLVTDSLRWIIDDERFIKAIEDTMLDYRSDVEPLLLEEDAKKRRYCDWASEEPLRRCAERGITIGNPISQMIGGLVMCRLDHKIKEVYRIKGYHRHCDDKVLFHPTLEEARDFLRLYDTESNMMGLCLKSTSFYAPLKDEDGCIDGRALDFVGYVYSKDNMKVRKRIKKNFARKMHRVKSERRRRDLKAAYWGIFKWGKCKNLWNKITNNDMSFADKGIRTEKISVDDKGKRMFNVPPLSITAVTGMGVIWIQDFEDGITIIDKKDGKPKTGRCCVMFREDAAKDNPAADKKFITSSKLIIGKLLKAREMEKNGEKVFPVDTRIFRANSTSGFPTWDME